LPEDEQRSKHGGGGRYNAILEFKGSKYKKERRRNKVRKNDEKRKIYEYV
jgi:hypothetical protein